MPSNRQKALERDRQAGAVLIGPHPSHRVKPQVCAECGNITRENDTLRCLACVMTQPSRRNLWTGIGR